MRDFYGDHSGDDEEVPADPGYRIDKDNPAYPDSPLPAEHEDMVSEGGPVYHDPTQPVEPVYPVPGDVDEPVNVDVDSDESFLDKVKRWVTGDND